MSDHPMREAHLRRKDAAERQNSAKKNADEQVVQTADLETTLPNESLPIPTATQGC